MSHTYLVTHTHHIIPKYAGGTDHPSNLVTLSVEEHAKAHWVLFQLYGNWQDWNAYRLLSSEIGMDEFRHSLALRNLEKMNEESVSCNWCKKSFSKANWTQHEKGRRCKHPDDKKKYTKVGTPYKGTYSKTISCRSCKKSFSKSSWHFHEKGSVVHIETRECWPLKKFLRHHKSTIHKA